MWGRARQKQRTFGLLGIRLGLRLPDELAQLIHLSKRHLPEQRKRDTLNTTVCVCSHTLMYTEGRPKKHLLALSYY